MNRRDFLKLLGVIPFLRFGGDMLIYNLRTTVAGAKIYKFPGRSQIAAVKQAGTLLHADGMTADGKFYHVYDGAPKPGYVKTTQVTLEQSLVTTITTQADFDALMSDDGLAPGSIVILQGNFTGDHAPQFAGTAELPIEIIGKDFHLDGSLWIDTPYTHWRNLNIAAAGQDYAFYVAKAGTELSYSDIAGGSIGVGWFGSGVGAIHNCRIHDTLDSYGLYSHNDGGGLRTIENCIFENIGGYYDMHFYSDANRIRDYLVTGCATQKPVIVHSGERVENFNLIRNNFGSWVKLGNGQTLSDYRQYHVAYNTFKDYLYMLSWTELSLIGNTFQVNPWEWAKDVFLWFGNNTESTWIDRNRYIGGWFVIDDTDWLTFSQWQALGYDLHGAYQ